MKTCLNIPKSFFQLVICFLLSWAVGAPPAALGSAQKAKVNIIDGRVDVNRDGVVDTADNLDSVLLFFDDAAPIRADIISGYLDLDGNGLINEPSDSLANADLTWKFGVLAPPISKEVDIINGQVDVDGGGISNSDDLQNVWLVQVPNLPAMETLTITDGIVSPDTANVLLPFNDAALLRVSIVNGLVDVDQNHTINMADHLRNADWEVNGEDGQLNEQVTIISGCVDVDQDRAITTADDAIVRVVKLNAPSKAHPVDVIDGKVDVDRNGTINSDDDLNNVLVLFNDAAAILVNIVDGHVDVNQDGVTGRFDHLANVDLTRSLDSGLLANDSVDIINGLIDENQDGVITTDDDAYGVQLFVP